MRTLISSILCVILLFAYVATSAAEVELKSVPELCNTGDTCPIPADIYQEQKSSPPITTTSEATSSVMEILQGKNSAIIAMAFFVFGVLLAFTPCTFPILLVLATFLMSQGISVTKGRVFKLSLTYVLAMALTYACAGIASAILGVYIQVYFQQPWVILSVSVFMILMALSLLGAYKIQIPQSVRSYLVRYNKLSISNSYTGVALMGIVATIFASPCTAAPLISSLTFISQTGNIFIGGLALFSMGLGVGTPLLVMSVAGNNIIMPKLQNWQSGLQIFFGLLIIAVAIWFASRVISPVVILGLWSALAISTAIYMGALRDTSKEGGGTFWRTMSIMLLVYGVALFVGALIGNKDPINPLAIDRPTTANSVQRSVSFQDVGSYELLLDKLNIAKTLQRPVILDFYADWCMTCKTMEKSIFQDEQIVKRLQDFVSLRVDLTTLDEAHLNIAKKFDVKGPPAIIFFDAKGDQLVERIDGEVTQEKFLQVIDHAIVGQNHE